MYRYGWGRYVPVRERRAKAARELEKMRKKGANLQPVTITGRTIASTFWGKAWCEHLEKFSDYENRLPRGRTYVRNGSVCHLDVRRGGIEAKVIGSSLYTVKIAIKTLPDAKWTRIRKQCAGRIGTMLELLQGRLSGEVMAVVTDRDEGLFPLPNEIELKCSCPDWAGMCKHVAAVLYGVGARLDSNPDLLFLLRGVDHTALPGAEAADAVVSKAKVRGRRVLEAQDLSAVFGIDVTGGDPRQELPNVAPAEPQAAQPGPARKRTSRKAAKPPPNPARKGAKAANHKKTRKRPAKERQE